MSELHELTALEQGSLIRAREIRAVELAEHYLRRSADCPGGFVVLTPELALTQAAAVDQAVDRGDPLPGPLAGVVCPVKDLDDVAGVPSRYGSALISVVPERDRNVVAAMRSAGLVFTGKTNTPEFGLPCYTEPDPAVAEPARCPWDRQRTAGGSSGGAAVAVARGAAPIAQGSDGGGSVRIPASACGLVGLKPSRGRISNGPLPDPIGDLPSYGPLARTVPDAAALLDVMARRYPGDPFWNPPPPDGSFLAATESPPGRLRIGVFLRPVIADVDVHPQARAAVDGAVAVLKDLGHDVVEVPPPFTPDRVAAFEAVWQALAGLLPLPPEIEQGLLPMTRYLRQQAGTVSGVALARAVAELRSIERDLAQMWDHVDAVVCPTVNGPPPRIADLVHPEDPARDFEDQKAWASYTSPFNITGRPAVSMPLHWTADGLPVGVQFVGRPTGDAELLRLCAQVEGARPGQRRSAAW